MTATSKRVLAYLALALIFYAIGFAGAPAAMLFIAVGAFFEGFVWMEARRKWRRRGGIQRANRY
ncbi:MAG TPA: hypothetical protein VFY39_03740 [Gammaproteobacteria bacterium]|nr:hypothetical protein [Gammaproteobacteria bacterium]